MTAKREYKVTITYERPSQRGKTHTWTENYWTSTETAARRKGREEWWKTHPNRAYSWIKDVTVRLISVAAPLPTDPEPRLTVGQSVKWNGRPGYKIMASYVSRDAARTSWVIIEDQYGQGKRLPLDQLERAQHPVIKEEYYVVYPTSAQYGPSVRPVQSSQYGVENLVQVKITKQDGVIINKEFV